MKKNILFLTFILAMVLFSCKEDKNNLPDGLFAQIETNKGTIIVQLDYKNAPVTVANFVSLAEGENEFIVDENLKNKPFYDGLKFHRVIADFMIQTGDPLGTGSGGTGYKFKDEFSGMKFDKGGVMAMANNGPATNSSQFFITHLETPWLEGKHTIFGHVVENGMEVVNKIVENDFIEKVTIIRNGDAAKKFDAIKTFQDYYKQETAANSKFKAIFEEKVKEFETLKAKSTKTSSGLQYAITKKSKGKKPTKGANIYINYSGYLEDGSLFDSSIIETLKTYGKLDETRSAQNGYQPIAFEAGKKEGLIPGFIEGIEQLSFGEKATIFIPAALGYGSAGAGDVIPPNANIIFEIELLEK